MWDKWPHILNAFRFAEQWNEHRQIGHWPDLDMLPLGHLEILPAERGPTRWTRLTHDEQIAMMTLWIMFRSPLIVGANLVDLDDWTLKLLTNPEVLEITRASSENGQHCRSDDEIVWTARGPRGDTYLALFNLRGKPAKMTVGLKQFGIAGRVRVRDLWAREDVGDTGTKIAAQVPARGARLFRVLPDRD